MSTVARAAAPEPAVDRTAREAEIRAACAAGDLRGAITASLDLYGNELLGFLAATSDHHDSAADVYAELCEVLCVELVGFEWRSSLRTWMYALARHARLRHEERQRRDAARQVPLSRAPELPVGPASTVALHQRTTMKERLEQARERLAAEERELLVLRVDRGLPWSEIAVVLGTPVEDVSRVSAALRKRFERTLEKLRAIFDELRVADQRSQ